MKILLPLDGTSCSTSAVDAVVAQFRPARTHVRLLHGLMATLQDLGAGRQSFTVGNTDSDSS